MQRAWVGKYSLSAATALTTVLVYLPALHNEFVNWDDDRYIFENLHIRSFNGEFFRWALLPYKGKDESQIRLTPDPNIITRFHRKMVELDL